MESPAPIIPLAFGVVVGGGLQFELAEIVKHRRRHLGRNDPRGNGLQRFHYVRRDVSDEQLRQPLPRATTKSLNGSLFHDCPSNDLLSSDSRPGSGQART